MECLYAQDKGTIANEFRHVNERLARLEGKLDDVLKEVRGQ